MFVCFYVWPSYMKKAKMGFKTLISMIHFLGKNLFNKTCNINKEYSFLWTTLWGLTYTESTFSISCMKIV